MHGFGRGVWVVVAVAVGVFDGVGSVVHKPSRGSTPQDWPLGHTRTKQQKPSVQNPDVH
jgi:hypothetical protein